MFKALGALIVLYTVFSALRGEVYAKHRVWGRTILRDEQPRYFWLVIGIYGLLAAALIFVF
jgi:hypothetical protein